MRKLLIPLLLASALVPATAYAKDEPVSSRDQHSRSDRGDSDNSSKSRSSGDRPQRAERAPRVERSERADRPVRVERVDRAVRIERADRNAGEQRIDRRFQRTERPVIQNNVVQQVQTVEPVQRVQRVERRKPTLADGFREAARQQEDRRDGDRDRWRDRDRDGNWRDRDRDNDRWRDRDGNWRRWSSDWRRDNRYDWHSYRNRYGSLFRLGRYYDPYGYGYRRFSIGFTLWPSYYGSSFWLDDPWEYRLPPAYGPYRWVRYYDDALLVNIYTGQVVDVIHNVFW